MKPYLIVASAASVWRDLDEWGSRPARVIAVNRMMGRYPGKIWMGATLHHELAAEFRLERPGAWPLVAPEGAEGVTRTFPKLDQWNGTSALYAVRIALSRGADRIVLAGAPIDEGAHCYESKSLSPWLNQYRLGWTKMLPQLRGRVRSLSGWTQSLLGSPFDGDWLNG
ncbi:hypothetical protein [Azospirillum sp. TSO5]|uniref:hypothetical protein n=1 Tax=Azospirillum sp. TSO5 TaxID=716760 RepID=UPI000D618158|nr:hypothetical protein [Azospirillum sp. TSO5]PWC96966.1 hypothetical protein TSO5_05920 [Azospirillum sp. TSO5]